MSEESGLRIGIDLGTSNSLAAYMVGGEPVVIRNGLGELLTPSVVAVDDHGQVLVGSAARARAVTHPKASVAHFKRDMGTDRRYRLGGRKFTPEELSALVLKQLREDVEAATGQQVVEAVVTVPAYFGEDQRRATAKACEIAGLHVERIINEPTAAALAYGVQNREEEAFIAVLDLGGGTFDVSLLELIDGVIEIRSTAGDARLGGEDFLDALIDEICRVAGLDRQALASKSGRGWATLRASAETAKRRLSNQGQGRVAVPELDLELEVDNERFEACCEPLLRRMEACIRRALRDAKLPPDRFEQVLLVGGATRMPIVESLAARVFGRLPQRSLAPDEAVALGAAVQVAIKADDSQVEDLVVTDIAPFSLGVDTANKLGRSHVDGVFSPVIDRGTVLPASRVETYSTLEARQTEVVFSIYQGEHAHVSRNVKLGTLRVTGVPPGPAGAESISVRFTYDLNGLLEVDATVESTGAVHSLLLGQKRAGMSDKEVKSAQAAMARLKFHPRDALPNTTALERAESLYLQLSGDARQLLGQQIANFRGALSGQDPQEIESARSMLIHLCESLRGG